MVNSTTPMQRTYDLQYHYTLTKQILKSKWGYIWVHTQLHKAPVATVLLVKTKSFIYFHIIAPKILCFNDNGNINKCSSLSSNFLSNFFYLNFLNEHPRITEQQGKREDISDYSLPLPRVS